MAMKPARAAASIQSRWVARIITALQKRVLLLIPAGKLALNLVARLLRLIARLKAAPVGCLTMRVQVLQLAQNMQAVKTDPPKQL